MENQQRAALDSIGGEPLKESGFESETPVFQEEITFAASVEEEEGKRQ